MEKLIQISEPESKEKSKEKFSIFSYGFRPFFLAATIYAILPLLPWLLYLNSFFEPTIPLQSWHAHEMFFGFVTAAISGFLLTAIPSWTGTPPLSGSKLAFLFSLWLVGRVVFWLYLFFDYSIFAYLLFLDLLLPVVQGMRVTKIFIKTNSKRNFIFVGMIAMLAIANLLVILDLNGFTNGTASIGSILAPNIIIIMIGVVGGRVTPNFTRGYLKQTGVEAEVKTFLPLEVLAIGLLIVNVIADLTLPHSLFSSIVALLAFVVHLVRFSFWQSLKALGNPILWVLHLGYIWLLITLFLKGAEFFLDLPYNLYLHAFTIGTVGTYIMGIMSRASLGHTGRKLKVEPIIILSYICVSIAALVRIITPFSESFYIFGMSLSVTIWVSGFGMFLWVYAPILTSPRVDGKAG